MNKYFQISHKRDRQTTSINFHSHDFYEIYFFVDGNVTYYIENESYNLAKGDVLVIPPGKIHRPVFEKSKDYERYVLWIFNEFISSEKSIRTFLEQINQTISEKHTRRILFKDEDFVEVKYLFDRLTNDYFSENQLSVYTAQSCNILVLDKILNGLKLSQIYVPESEDIAVKVISYINENIVNAPTLDELAEKLYVSKYYLSHKFKEYTKTTIHQYILMKKINLSKQMLEKGIAPNKVYTLCGFSTYSNFYKAFTEQTKVSPKEFQKRYLYSVD